jgi:pimeloyl-ACP methyl ester carboxylesterase
MKKLAIIVLVLLIQNNIFSQIKKKTYPFEVEIRGKGEPIIFIPGLASKGSVWNQVVDSLKNKYECHILTLAGFAKQKPISLEKGYLPKMTNEIINYIINETNKKPILIGHSLGGFISLSIASSQSELLSKIIVVDSYPFMSSANNPNVTSENIIPQAEQMKEMLLTMSDRQFIKQQKLTIPKMVTDSSDIRSVTNWSILSDRATIAQATYELMTTDLRQDIGKIKIPILVLGSWYGLKEYGITKEAVKMSYENQFLKANNYKIEISDTARHFIMLDDSKWFLKLVKSFIVYEK